MRSVGDPATILAVFESTKKPSSIDVDPSLRSDVWVTGADEDLFLALRERIAGRCVVNVDERRSDRPDGVDRDAEDPVSAIVVVVNQALNATDVDMGVDRFDEVWRVRATSVLRAVRDRVGSLPADGTGRVVVVIGSAASRNDVDYVALATTRAAAVGLVRAWARDLESRQVAVVGLVVCGLDDGGRQRDIADWIATAVSSSGSLASGGIIDLSSSFESRS